MVTWLQDQYVEEALGRIEGATVARLLHQLSSELIRLQVSARLSWCLRFGRLLQSQVGYTTLVAWPED